MSGVAEASASGVADVAGVADVTGVAVGVAAGVAVGVAAGVADGFADGFADGLALGPSSHAQPVTQRATSTAIANTRLIILVLRLSFIVYLQVVNDIF